MGGRQLAWIVFVEPGKWEAGSGLDSCCAVQRPSQHAQPCLLNSTAVFDREQHTLHLPAVNSITYVLRFLEKLCRSLRSENLFGNQPFSQTHVSLSTTEYSHSHDRYLPGRSWDGVWAKRGQGH